MYLCIFSLLILADDAKVLGPVGEWGGWTSAGLLSAVLGWLLLRYLPAKDQQIKDMIESRDKLAERMAEIAGNIDKDRRDSFKEQLQLVVNHCKEETESINSNLRADIGRLGETITELRRSIDSISSSKKQG